MRDTRLSCRILPVFMLGLSICAGSALAAGNDCPAILPAEAVTFSPPRLCTLANAGNDLSVCRTYHDSQRFYQLVFRGGTSPVAVYESREVPANSPTEISRHGTGKRQCDHERPNGVPESAVYRGTGVCQDEQGLPLPCSLFEYTGAREPQALRYFVYFEPDGRGVRRIDTLVAGPNEHALVAELAFQFGRALSLVECCRERAEEYLAYASLLFPADREYHSLLHAIRTPQTNPDRTLDSDCASAAVKTLSSTQPQP